MSLRATPLKPYTGPRYQILHTRLFRRARRGVDMLCEVHNQLAYTWEFDHVRIRRGVPIVQLAKACGDSHAISHDNELVRAWPANSIDEAADKLGGTWLLDWVDLFSREEIEKKLTKDQLASFDHWHRVSMEAA